MKELKFMLKLPIQYPIKHFHIFLCYFQIVSLNL